MAEFAAIMLMLNTANKLTPVIMPRLISIVKSIKGLTDEQIMSIEEFELSIRDTQADAKDWQDPL